MSEDERPLLARLREQKAQVVARIAEETDVHAVYHLNAEVAELTQRIADAEAGVPACRYCGSTAIVAWYSVDERQGIDIERAEDGSLAFEYDGDTSTGEVGPDEEYRCRNCDQAASTLEYLVGDTDEDGPSPRFAWWGWSEGEDDCDPPEPGKRWLTITKDGEELAIIVHRLTGKDDEAERMREKEGEADRIVAALNSAFTEPAESEA